MKKKKKSLQMNINPRFTNRSCIYQTFDTNKNHMNQTYPWKSQNRKKTLTFLYFQTINFCIKKYAKLSIIIIIFIYYNITSSSSSWSWDHHHHHLEVSTFRWLNKLPVMWGRHFFLQLHQYIFHCVLSLPIRHYPKLLWLHLQYFIC